MRLTSGISTGHTDSQRPQNVEASAASRADADASSAGISAAPIGPG